MLEHCDAADMGCEGAVFTAPTGPTTVPGFFSLRSREGIRGCYRNELGDEVARRLGDIRPDEDLAGATNVVRTGIGGE